MKSLFIIVLVAISVFAKQGLAYDKMANREELEELLVEYLNENNVDLVDNNESISNLDINEFNSNLDNNEINGNLGNNEFNSNLDNIEINGIIDNNSKYIINENDNDSGLLNIIPSDEIDDTLPTDNENKSYTSAYILGGVGVTSVALIAVIGYKNYKKRSLKVIDVLFEKVENSEEEEEEKEKEKEKECIIKPEEIKSAKALDRLRKSMSLNLKNESCDKPISESIYTDYIINKNRAYRCQVAWTPIMEDEIMVNLGDFVCVKEIFDDGYCLGRNLSTKFYGVFPTCCVTRPDELLMGSDLVENGEFVSVLKRTSSKSKNSKRNRNATMSAVFPSWSHNNDLNFILTH